jgi:hypothetical protein
MKLDRRERRVSQRRMNIVTPRWRRL